MRNQGVRLLLVEDRLDELCLLNEIVSELNEEHRHRRGIGGCELIHALNAREAVDLLTDVEVDAILMDATSEQDSAAGALSALRACRPETPVIALSDGSNVTDETQLIRMGAQDVLWKCDLDCLPLARSVRFAIERQRALTSIRSIIYQDELTGLYNELGFREVAGHALRTAQAARLPCGMVISELCPGEEPGRDADLLLIEFADLLRGFSKPIDVLGRIGPSRFAVLTPENGKGGQTAALLKQLQAGGQERDNPGSHAMSEPALTLPLGEMIGVAEASLAGANSRA